MDKITPQPGIMDIKLYVSGESAVEGKSDVLKLSANENPYGFSDKAREAFTRSVQNLHRYPNTDHAPLRNAISKVYDIDPNRIICGVGSDEVLQFVAQAYAGIGDEIIVTEHGFAMYPILAHAVGATPIEVAEKERRVDVHAILDAVTEKTRIVFIANPANPTGTFLDEAELLTLIEGLPASVILVLDGAYTEFAEGYNGGVHLVDQYPNLIMTRTFSKIYGLGGLRIGWGYAQQDMINVLLRLRQPFNLSEPQMEAAAAAVQDIDFTQKCQVENAKWREWLRNALVQMGVSCDKSYANFVLARFESEKDAAACDAALRRMASSYAVPPVISCRIA